MSGWTPGIEKVLAHLRDTRGQWRVLGDEIRRKCHDGWACPVSSLEDANESAFDGVALSQGIDPEEAEHIVDASDSGWSFMREEALRAALIDAAGLSEASE